LIVCQDTTTKWRYHKRKMNRDSQKHPQDGMTYIWRRHPSAATSNSGREPSAVTLGRHHRELGHCRRKRTKLLHCACREPKLPAHTSQCLSAETKTAPESQPWQSRSPESRPLLSLGGSHPRRDIG